MTVHKTRKKSDKKEKRNRVTMQKKTAHFTDKEFLIRIKCLELQVHRSQVQQPQLDLQKTRPESTSFITQLMVMWQHVRLINSQYSFDKYVFVLVAKSVKKGVEAAGAEAILYQIPETLSKEILGKMHAPEKDSIVPVITHDESGENTVNIETALLNCDGIIFGYPCRFGAMPAQVKAFMDSTGGLWMKGALVGKPFSIFFSTATQGGG